MWKKAYTTNMATDTSADESFSTVYGDEERNDNFMPPLVRTESMLLHANDFTPSR